MREKTCGGCNIQAWEIMQLLSCPEKTCGGYNTSMVNYRTAAMRGKSSGGYNTNAGIYAIELLPCAEKPMAVAI